MSRSAFKIRIFASVALAIFAQSAIAQEATTQPAESEQITRPLLNQLNHETRSLFRQIAPGIVRVQLPIPTNVTFIPDSNLSKWTNQLDAEARARLMAQIRHASGNGYSVLEIQPTTNVSSTQPAPGQGSRIMVMQLDRFTPNSIGIVVDDKGHLLIPRFVDKDACDRPIRVAIGDGRLTSATFVASDMQTDLTILQVNDANLKPPAISQEKPDQGTLLLVMSLNPASNRLAVWEGWEPDVAAIVDTEGRVAGFTKYGHFLSAAACAPAVQELIDHGYVRRARLGVEISMVGPDDELRQANPALGATPALLIRQVFPGTAAERAGLKPGDFILSLAGQSVGNVQSFAAAIADRRGKTEAGILRNAQHMSVTVDLQVPEH